MLPSKLAKLGEDFDVSTIKSKFPYKFATQDNLFYKGVMPSIDNYSKITTKEYQKIYLPYWDMQQETIKYLNNDLYSLHEILSRANKQVFKDYNINISDKLSIAGVALRIFLKDYYKFNIPLVNKASMYNDLKQAYYGGITEVYKPWGHNLYYYDVNSLYPYVALEDMPGLTCNKLLFYKENEEIDNLFGFFYCKIETPLDGYLGLLPVKEIGLTFPLGKWKGWYFSEELKFAKLNGYKIKVLKGYSFNREKDVFKSYIDKIYKIKSNPVNPSQKTMAKSLLNNLLGRFGISLDKPVTEIFSKSYYKSLIRTNKIVDGTSISDDKVLVTYVPKLDYEVVKEHNLDFLSLVNAKNDKELGGINATSVVISAAITAYARIHMNKLKLAILDKGGKLYYSDTDSIVTNIELPESLVNEKELGLLKLEHKVNEAIFISNKIYYLRDKNGKTSIKAKGIKSESLSYTYFITLYNENNIKLLLKQLVKGCEKVVQLV